MEADPLVLRIDGPIVDAEVADPDRPSGNAYPVRLLVDTGAELSVIPRDLIDGLGRPRIRDVEIAGNVPRVFMRCPVFEVVLHVTGTAFVVDIAALARGDVASGILGRDVLSHLRFSYDGPAGTFGLTTG